MQIDFTQTSSLSLVFATLEDEENPGRWWITATNPNLRVSSRLALLPSAEMAATFLEALQITQTIYLRAYQRTRPHANSNLKH